MAWERSIVMNIYVGNLSYSTTDDGLRKAFEAFGSVDSARVIMDRESGRSKGFGFVEMSDKAQADAAIAGLNGKDLDGRTVTVNESRPKAPGNGGGGGRGGFGGGRGGYGGGEGGGGRGGYGGGRGGYGGGGEGGGRSRY